MFVRHLTDNCVGITPQKGMNDHLHPSQRAELCLIQLLEIGPSE